MIVRRINIRLGDVVGAGEDFNIANEERTRANYLNEADKLILSLTGQEYAGGVLETSHFEDHDA